MCAYAHAGTKEGEVKYGHIIVAAGMKNGIFEVERCRSSQEIDSSIRGEGEDC